MKQICLFLLSLSIFSIFCVQMSDAEVKANRSGRRKVVMTQNKSKTKPKIRFINPTTLAKSPSYTHVVEVTGGRTIYIAGQIALDSSGNIVGRGDFRAQTGQV